MSSKNLRQRWKEEYCKEWFQFILYNQGQDWDYNWLSTNLNITWDIIQNNPDINWSHWSLSTNPMTKQFNDYMEKKEIAYKIIDRYTNRDIAEMIMSMIL